jgi:hypothetical protein
MKYDDGSSLNLEYPTDEEIEAALKQAVQQALWEHKQLGHHIIIWRDGKVVRLPPEEIQVERPSAAQ